MSLPNDQLFLDRFIAFNANRYSGEPGFVSQLNALTLQNTQFTNFRKVEIEPGVFAHLVDVDVEGVLTGDDQRYTPADYVNNGPAHLEEPDPVVLDLLEKKGVQGIFFLGVDADDKVGAVLVYNGRKTIENIKTIVKEKCLFDLTDDNITINDDLTLVSIDSHTIVGVLQVVEGLYDDVHRYNGQFVHDGTITY